ncbi:MAG: hypothetical protein IAE91_14250, partial [Ignavibacteriaceae bacterium]|nr:hypothetical protein [Ignavibacteriaceae bacterium]
MSQKINNTSIILTALLQHSGRLAASVTNTDSYDGESIKFFGQLAEKFPFLIPHYEFFKSFLNGDLKKAEEITGLAKSVLINSEAGGENLQNTTLPDAPLLNILSKIEIDENRTLPNEFHFFKPCIISEFFSSRDRHSTSEVDNKKREEIKSENAKLFGKLKEEILSLPLKNSESFVDTLLNLFEKYFSFSASNITINPDVSFYDEVKTAAGLSSCLNLTENPEKPFILLNADLSGIQSFLYSDDNPIENSKRGLNKRLRGKSFYLSLLSDFATDYFLRELNLLRVHVLMNGGGHFILLLPNQKEILKKIEEIREKIQIWLFEEYKGALTLNLAYLEADVEFYQKFEVWYAKLSDKLLETKRRKN